MKYTLTIFWRIGTPTAVHVRENPFQTNIDDVPHFNTECDAVRWTVNGVDSVYHWNDIESFTVTPIPSAAAPIEQERNTNFFKAPRCDYFNARIGTQCVKVMSHIGEHEYLTK